MLKVVTGLIMLARGDHPAAAEAEAAARDLLSSARYEDQHQLPLASLEIALRLATGGPAAALAVTGQMLDRYDLSLASPRYAWPVVTAGAAACLAAARHAGPAHDQHLRDEATAVADRLRTVAEKLEAFGRAQRAQQLTFAATDAQVASLLDGFPGAGGSGFPGAGASGFPGAGASGVLLEGWDRAATAWADLGEPYPLAQTLLHAAETALAGGDRDGAGTRLRESARLAAGLGAQPLAEQAALLARRARIALDGGEDEPLDSPGGLTGRELEVLRLVAAGRSNREIAAELFISPKTASVHVSNILGKLGAASRGEAAAKALALRLLDPGPA
jgi:DNA-binding CsgD family transcriptional regulator